MSKNTYDVIIIGAGSIGVPAAHRLAAEGLEVLVIDKFASQGQGSNKAAIGGIRATHSDPAKIKLCQRTLEIVSTWEDVYGHNLEWTTGGYSFVAYRQKEEKTLKDLLVVQKGYGLNIDWYDKDALLERVPDLNPHGLIGGTISPEDGHCSTILAGHAYYDVAKQYGADFVYLENVVEILQENGRISGVRTDKNTYYAPVLINTAGPWANEVGKLAGFDHPVMPDQHEAGITEPVANFMLPMIVDIIPTEDSVNYYFYQLHSGQVVFCITPNPSIWGYNRNETSKFLPMVAKRMVNLMPKLANIRVRRTWRGLYPMTPDGSPLIGEMKELPGYLVAIGMCGQGFMLGPGLGELLCRMVVQKEVSADDQLILNTLSPYRQFKGMEALK